MLRFGLFVAVGVLNTAFGYTVFAIVYFLSGTYRVAIVLATALGIVFNYFTTGRIVFANRGIRAFVPFLLGYAVVCVVNILLVDWMVAAAISAYLAQAFALPVTVVLAFIINDRIVFRRWS